MHKVGSRTHTTSTSSVELVEPIITRSITKAKSIKTPPVTCKETFLPDVKILKPLDGVLPPDASQILPYSPKQRIVVGISGVSCGGKTTVSRALTEWLGESGKLIMQDNFYKDVSTLPINPITNFPEFDEPESVNMHLVRDAITQWLEEPMEADEDTQVLIVEGTMIFTDPEICALCDLRYLVHVNFDVAEYRRSLRNYPIPDPPAVVEKNIWPKYIKHREIFRMLARDYGFISKQIDGTIPVSHIVAGILSDVKVNRHQ